MKRKLEKLDRTNWEQKRQIEEFCRKEEKGQESSLRVIEQLKNEIKEKERERNMMEVKEGYEK
jgi:hypothetical protein